MSHGENNARSSASKQQIKLRRGWVRCRLQQPGERNVCNSVKGGRGLASTHTPARSASFHVAFPDLHFTLEDLMAEGDRVVFRATLRGTQHGMFAGSTPTGKRIMLAVPDIVHIEDGVFVE